MRMITKRARPWRASPTILLDAAPDASIAVYGDQPGMIVVTIRRADGHGYRSFLADPAEVAAVLACQSLTTGLLPAGTLTAGTVGDAPFRVQWRAPQPVALAAVTGEAGGATRRYHFPAPTLAWGALGDDYRLFALATDGWPDADAPLFAAPFPNVFPNGGICWGSGARPGPVGATTLDRAWATFVGGSLFSWHAAGGRCRGFPANVLVLYHRLEQDGAATFPADELLPTTWTVGDLVEGSLWGARRHG